MNGLCKVDIRSYEQLRTNGYFFSGGRDPTLLPSKEFLGGKNTLS